VTHRVQALQRGGPLDADGVRGTARGAGGAGARAAAAAGPPGARGQAELLHAAGATALHQLAHAVQADGGEEPPQGELGPAVALCR